MRQKYRKTTLVLLCALCLALALAGDYEAKAGPGATGVIDSYASNVTARIKRHFAIPPEWRKRNYEATARVDIDKTGRVTGASITRPSGNAAFDTAVLTAIIKTGSLGRPPFELYAVGLRFSSKM